jgi:hypothetical protein
MTVYYITVLIRDGRPYLKGRGTGAATLKNLNHYWFAIVCLVVVCIAGTAVATYVTLNTALLNQSREEIGRARALNKIHNTLMLPVLLSRMMRNNTFVSDWIAGGETDLDPALRYLQSIRDTWSVDAFIASNRTRSYYFSDGTYKALDRDTPDVGWFFYLIENNIDVLADVGYNNGDPTQPFLYVDYQLPRVDGKNAGYVGAAVKLGDFLPDLKAYRDRYGIDLHFINQAQMVILSSDAGVVNSKASAYSWYRPAVDPNAPHRSTSRIVNVQGERLSVNDRYLADLGWRLFMVDHGTSAGSRLVDLALGSIVLYSVLLLAVTALLTYLFRRFRRDLEAAFAQIKTLRGIIPICSHCKKIRDDQGYWNQLETYISEHSDADLSHGICPDCVAKLYPEFEQKD